MGPRGIVSAVDADVAAQPLTAKGEVRATEPSRLQQAMARRVAESAATIPAGTVEARAARPGGDVAAAVAAAFATALAAHPRANGAWRDGRLERYSRVNVAVVLDAADGFVAPTLFDADTKDAATLARETDELAGAARDGRLTSPQLSGATATLWVVRDVERVTAPVSPGQAVALAAAVPAAGDIGLTLACDQRIVPVTDAAALLARIRDVLTG